MLQTVEKIKKAIISLSKEDLSKLREWYDEFEAREWDQRLNQMLNPESWTGWRKKRSMILKPGDAAKYETLCQPGLLGVLKNCPYPSRNSPTKILNS